MTFEFYKYGKYSTGDDFNKNNHGKRSHRENLHHRSFLFGIGVGTSFAVFFIFLPSLSIFLAEIKPLDKIELMVVPNAEKAKLMIAILCLKIKFLIYQNRIKYLHFKYIFSTMTEPMLNLYEKVRILCMIFTYEKNFKRKAYVVKKTWGSRCNKLLFMSNTSDPNNLIDVTVLNLTESRDTLWQKTKLSFKHAYDHFLYDFDWFLKADDDTYVVMENLRYFLYPYPSDLPLLFGFQLSNYTSGYILSREAILLFNEKAVKDKNRCSQAENGVEYADIAQCLQNVVNVTFGDTRDVFGKERFLSVDIRYVLDTHFDHNETGIACCSNTAISFHYMSPETMLAVEYFLYHFKVYSMDVAMKDLPPKFTKTDMDIMFPWKNIRVHLLNKTFIV